MNNNSTNDSYDFGIIYTESIVCEKKTDTSVVSDSLMNIIKDSVIIEQLVEQKVMNDKDT